VRRVEVYEAIYAQLIGSTQEVDGDRPIRQRIQSVVPWTPVARRSGKMGTTATVPT